VAEEIRKLNGLGRDLGASQRIRQCACRQCSWLSTVGFAGGLLDAQTRLLRFGVRDYDPMIGRWIAKDPLGFGGSLANLYRYSRNDPINWSDPSGLFITPTHEEIISDTFIGRLPYADRAIL